MIKWCLWLKAKAGFMLLCFGAILDLQYYMCGLWGKATVELTCTSSKVLYSSFLWHQTLFLVGGGTATGHLQNVSHCCVYKTRGYQHSFIVSCWTEVRLEATVSHDHIVVLQARKRVDTGLLFNSWVKDWSLMLSLGYQNVCIAPLKI